MAPFSGFNTDRSELVPIPAEIFTEILPSISRPGELKLTLHIFWLLSRQQEAPKCVCFDELEHDEPLLRGLAALDTAKEPRQSLREALELAVRRGTVLRLKVEDGGNTREWFFVNTAPNKRLLTRWKRLKPAAILELLGRRAVKDPEEMPAQSIFQLYEENIGMLTPLVAEQLSEAESAYPAEWIRDAFSEAASLNKRNWRYVSRILENWATQGRQSGKNRQSNGKPIDPKEYRSGKYAHLFEPDGE